MSEKLDIEEVVRRVFERGAVTIEPEEHPEDRSARIKRASHALILGQVANAAVVLSLIAAGIFVATLALNENALISDWARNIFSALVAGGAGFFTGREVGRNR